MTRNWLCFVGCILGAGSGLVAQPVIQVPAAQEASLKQRVTGFWQPFVEGKFRLSDQYVSDASKDEYYSWPKRRIKGFTIDKIYYADAGKAAKVVTLVDVTMAMMGVGSMEIKQPVETWWRLEDGAWFWFQPKNETRQTPFGVMESNPASGEVAMLPTGQIMKAPSMETLWNMVKPDRTELHFTAGEAKIETILIKSALPGVAQLTSDTPAGATDFTFELTPKMIPRQGTASLVVTYKPTTKPAADAEPMVKIFRVGVAQTGKVYDIKILIDSKK